jgi:hypothetical protein
MIIASEFWVGSVKTMFFETGVKKNSFVGNGAFAVVGRSAVGTFFENIGRGSSRMELDREGAMNAGRIGCVHALSVVTKGFWWLAVRRRGIP